MKVNTANSLSFSLGYKANAARHLFTLREHVLGIVTKQGWMQKLNSASKSIQLDVTKRNVQNEQRSVSTCACEQIETYLSRTQTKSVHPDANTGHPDRTHSAHALKSQQGEKRFKPWRQA